MPISSTDLAAYASANKPEDETSPAGGAIDADVRIAFADISATGEVEAVSSEGADTMNLTVRGRNAAGSIVSETKALAGTTPITFSSLGSIERVLSATLASDAAGTVTVRKASDDVAIGSIPPGERGFRRLFIGAYSGEDAKTYYEKVFLRNGHGTLALLAAAVSESADPSAKIAFALADVEDDDAATANRLTAPAGGDLSTAFDSSAKAVPATDLAPGSAIGIWLRLSVGAGDAPLKSTYTVRLAGQTT